MAGNESPEIDACPESGQFSKRFLMKGAKEKWKTPRTRKADCYPYADLRIRVALCFLADYSVLAAQE